MSANHRALTALHEPAHRDEQGGQLHRVRSTTRGDIEMYGDDYRPDEHLPVDVYIVGRSAWGAGESYDRHPVVESDIELTLEGKGVLEVGKESHELLPGDVFIVRPNERLRYSTAPGASVWSKVFIDFYGGNTTVILKQLGLLDVSVVRVSAASLPRIRQLFDDMLVIARTKPLQYRDRLSEKAYALLLALSHETLGPAHRAVMPEVIQRVVTYVEAHLDLMPSVQRLSHIAGCSARHLNRHFSRHFGMSIHAWVTRTKIRHACLLLARTHSKIGEIAESLGYVDQLHFTKVFKRVMNTTPRDYRRNAHSDGPGVPEGAPSTEN